MKQILHQECMSVSQSKNLDNLFLLKLCSLTKWSPHDDSTSMSKKYQSALEKRRIQKIIILLSFVPHRRGVRMKNSEDILSNLTGKAEVVLNNCSESASRMIPQLASLLAWRAIMDNAPE